MVKMKIYVVKVFKLFGVDGKYIDFLVGMYMVDDVVVDNWYVKYYFGDLGDVLMVLVGGEMMVVFVVVCVELEVEGGWLVEQCVEFDVMLKGIDVCVVEFDVCEGLIVVCELEYVLNVVVFEVVQVVVVK